MKYIQSIKTTYPNMEPIYESHEFETKDSLILNTIVEFEFPKNIQTFLPSSRHKFINDILETDYVSNAVFTDEPTQTIGYVSVDKNNGLMSASWQISGILYQIDARITT